MLEKIQKQKLIASLHSIFSSFASNGTSNYKLWHYAVGVSSGLKKGLVFDPQYKDKPIVSLFKYTGTDDSYGNDSKFTESAIYSVIDAANEVCAFDLDKVNNICFDIWAHRQSMVYPMIMPIKAIDQADILTNVIGSSYHVSQNQYDKLSQKENEAIAIAVIKLNEVIAQLVKESKDESSKNIT